LADCMAHDGPYFLDVAVVPLQNCFPMMPAGYGHQQVMLSEDTWYVEEEPGRPAPRGKPCASAARHDPEAAAVFIAMRPDFMLEHQCPGAVRAARPRPAAPADRRKIFIMTAGEDIMFQGRKFARWFAAAALVGMTASAPVLAQTTLKMAYALSENSHYGAGGAAFAQSLQGSGTDFTIQQFPNSALGGEREVIEGLQLGTIDLAIVSTGATLNFVPQTGVFDIPFLFRDLAHARKVLDGKIGQDMLAAFPERGLVALAWGEQGFRHLTNNVRAVNGPADIKGLKIRTTENPIHIAAFKELGVLATPMAWPEVATALQ